MQTPTHSRRSPLFWPLALLVCAAAAFLSPSVALADGGSPGALYTETNNPDGNQVVVFARGTDGSITEVQRVNTHGVGSSPNQPFGQNHLDSNGPVELTDDGQLLFVVNAGDDSISSFQVGPKGRLTFADIESSGGDHPVSVDSHQGLLYALNVDSNNISGLRYTRTGKLTAIDGSSEQLATAPGVYPGIGFPFPLADQVIFSPDGSVLVVPERTSNNFQGQLDTFAVGSDGTPGPAQANPSNAFIPFGLAWDNHGHLVVANGGPPPHFDPGSGSTYSLSGTTLTALDNESAQTQATCWVTIPDNGKYAFMSDQDGRAVTRFAIGRGGQLKFLGNTPTSGLSADMALSNNSRYLYVLNIFNADNDGGATIDSYRVQSDGGLVHLDLTTPGIPDSASGLASK